METKRALGIILSVIMLFLTCVPVGFTEEATFAISSQPENAEAAIGEVATFTVKANEESSYQWQYSGNGTKFYNLTWASATTDTLEVDVTEYSVNWYYRCIVTSVDDDEKLTSNIVTITDVSWKEAPLWVSAEQTADGEVTLVWESVIGADGYVLYTVNDDNVATEISQIESAVTFVHTGLENGAIGYKLATYIIVDEERIVSENESEVIEVKIETFVRIYGDFEYGYLEDGIIITGYIGNDSEVVVPLTIEEMDVIAIGEKVFEGNTELVSINLPDTIETIGKRAFADCTNLSSMN